MTKISVIRGDSRTIQVTFTDSSNQPVDLTGAELFFTVNASSDPTDDSSAAIHKTVSVFTDPTSGVATISLSGTDTDIDPKTYFYDVQIKDASGDITSSKQDKFTVTADISRSTS